MNTTLSYIFADDDIVYREVTLQQLQLIPNLQRIAVCANAMEATVQLQQHNPDLLILDVEMPGLSGIQLAKSFARQQTMNMVMNTSDMLDNLLAWANRLRI
ncbi:MAG: response regulator [Chitinophagaceae bacterium]|nr:response regulator [Chitinophagaceae bacterium]